MICPNDLRCTLSGGYGAKKMRKERTTMSDRKKTETASWDAAKVRRETKQPAAQPKKKKKIKKS